MKKLIIILLTSLQSTTSMTPNMHINDLPDEMIAEIITFAAIQEAYENKLYCSYKKLEQTRKNIDEGRKIGIKKIEVLVKSKTTSEWSNAAIKPHFIAFNSVIASLSLVCKKWNKKTILDNTINSYTTIYKIPLTYLVKPIVLKMKLIDEQSFESIEEHKQYKRHLAMLNMLCTKDMITSQMINCLKDQIGLSEHPHFSYLITQIHLLGGSRSLHINRPTNWSLLHYAAYTYNPEVLQLLLSTNIISINTQDTAGVTPLHIATHRSNIILFHTETKTSVRHMSNNQYACIQLLLTAGADPSIQDIRGKTAADYTDVPKVHELLQQYMPEEKEDNKPPRKKRKLL